MPKQRTSTNLSDAARENIEFIRSRVGCDQTGAIENALAHYAAWLAQRAELGSVAVEQNAAPDCSGAARRRSR